jgi:hypothetical protein
MSNVVDLLQPLLAGGIQRNHFFNGRLLSAEDLRAEQDASREQARSLALGLGEGVATGLDVLPAPASPPSATPTLRITAGVGFNRLGDPLRLAQDGTLRLVPPTTTAQVDGGLFAACEAPLTQPSLLSASIWVLVARPVSGLEGRAPMADLQAIAAGRGHCGARYATEGLAFRLLPVNPDLPHTLLPAAVDPTGGRQAALRTRIADEMARPGPEAAARLRSLLAHAAIGGEAVPPQAARWGVADALRERGLLSDCDLPLALLVLGPGGLRVLDTWAVRRPCAGPAAVLLQRAQGAGGRRAQEGEAAWQQFQAQLAGLTPAPGAAATRWLHALPAAGWLPAAWNWRAFLGEHAPPEATPVDAALLRERLVQGFGQDPVVLGQRPLAALQVWRAEGVPGVVFGRAQGAELRVDLGQTVATLTLSLLPRSGPVVGSLHAGTRHAALAGAPAGEGARLRVQAEGFEPLETALPPLVAGQVTQAGPLALVPLRGGTIEVLALDEASNQSLGARVLSVRAQQGSQVLDARWDRARDRWVFTDVPAGRWRLVGDAPGHRTTRDDDVGPVEPGQVLSATLLFERIETRLERPELCVAQSAALGTAGALSRIRSARLCLVLAGTVFDAGYHAARQPTLKARRQDGELRFGLEARAGSGRTQSAKLGFTVARSDGVLLSGNGSGPWSDFTPVALKDGALREWVYAWRAWFAVAFDDADLLKRTPQLRVAANYSRPSLAEGQARAFRETPPAWVDFGPFAVPVAIKFDDGRTRAPVAVETGAPFLGKRAAQRLADAGLRDVDDLAWAWTDLLVDATGLMETDLWLAMQEAHQAVARINADRAWVDGLTPEENQRLVQAGYDTDAKLAKATERELEAVLGSAFKARSVRQQVSQATVKPRVAKGAKAPGRLR